MKSVILFVAFLVLAFIAGVSVVIASQSSYTASNFSQFCASNPTTCNKVDFNDARIGDVSCPSTNQTIDQVYVHAGSGQLVTELPDSLFSYSFSNNQNTVSVTALQGTHDLSWIGVTCSTHTSSTPTPTQTPTCTPTPTITPTVTLTSTPTPTNTPECEACGGNTEVTPTPTTEVTPTPVDPTATPTPGSSNNNSSNSSDNSSSISGQVLGAAIGGPSTLAATGTAAENISFASFIAGILLIGAGILNHAKKTKTVTNWS